MPTELNTQPSVTVIALSKPPETPTTTSILQQADADGGIPQGVNEYEARQALAPVTASAWSKVNVSGKNKTCSFTAKGEDGLRMDLAFSHQGSPVVMAKIQWVVEGVKVGGRVRGFTLAVTGRPTIYAAAYRGLETDLFAFAYALKTALDKAVKTTPPRAGESLWDWQARCLADGVKAFNADKVAASTLLAAATSEMLAVEGLDESVVMEVPMLSTYSPMRAEDEEDVRSAEAERDRLWRLVKAGAQDDDTITKLIRSLITIRDIHGLTQLQGWIWDTFSPLWHKTLVDWYASGILDQPNQANGTLWHSCEVDDGGNARAVYSGRRGEAAVKVSARVVLVLPKIEPDWLTARAFSPRAVFVDGMAELVPAVDGLDAGLADMFVSALNAAGAITGDRFREWGNHEWSSRINPDAWTWGAGSTEPMHAVENVLVSLLADLEGLAAGGNTDAARLAIAQKPLFNGKSRGESTPFGAGSPNMAWLGGRTASSDGRTWGSMPIIPPVKR